jgi:small-conductance mechanosensitive channel
MGFFDDRDGDIAIHLMRKARRFSVSGMSQFLPSYLSNFWPAVALAVGFPLLLLALNEFIAVCHRRGWAVERTMRNLRNLVVPALALLVFVRFVLEWPQDSTASRLVESAFWILLLYALLGVVNDLVFGRGEPVEGRPRWTDKVPKLFRDLVRALLVAIGAMVVYSQVWGHEVSAALTALGLGSIVIGLALQEPLGNIVSGLMLLSERPLNVGDWIQVGDVRGRVIEINWRAVHIETPTRELQVIPNVELYKGTFANLSRPTPLRTEVIEMGFSYDDPPNRVKEVMLDMLRSTPGVLADPEPLVRTLAYADFSINYRLIFSVESQAHLPDVRDAVMSRLWYVIKRENITIPFPTALEYEPGQNPSKPTPTVSDLLASHPRFLAALKDGTPEPAIVDFAAGETVQGPDRPFDGFALVTGGRARLLAKDLAGQSVQIGEIGPGECFGDRLTAGGGSENIAIVAEGDLQVLVFADEVMDELLNKSPSLASEIGDAIEVRRQAAQAVRRRA